MKKGMFVAAFVGIVVLAAASPASALTIVGDDSFETFRWDTGSSQTIVQITVNDPSWYEPVFDIPELRNLPAGWAISSSDPGVWASASGPGLSAGQFEVWFPTNNLSAPISFEFTAIGPTTAPVTFTQIVTASWASGQWTLTAAAASNPPGVINPPMLSVVDTSPGAIVPEPATMALLGLGFAGLAGRRALRRRP